MNAFVVKTKALESEVETCRIDACTCVVAIARRKASVTATGRWSKAIARRVARGTHPSVLSGLCVVEDVGATLPTRRSGPRTTESIPGVGGHHPGRRGVTDAQRSDDPEALHQSSDRASGDPAATLESAPTKLVRNGPGVVKTRAYPR